MLTFSDFVGKHDRQHKEHLNILGHLLKKAGFHLTAHLDDRHEPHIFIHKPDHADSILENLSFGGIRLYVRGKDNVCWRPQMKEDVEPFGRAYLLDLRGTFKDILSDTHKKKETGKELARYVIEEIIGFFKDSAEAEREQEPGKGSEFGAAVAGSTGTDYSNMVFSKNSP